MSKAPHENATVKPRRERVFSIDLVRATATILIVITHFNNPFFSQGGYLLANRPFGVYIGDLGVSLFLIISGTVLALNYRQPIDVKSFYWKRFKGIYPMFWTAWVLGTLYFFIDSKGHPLNAAPVKSLIWTLLGIDGLVANFHLTTAYLLGEWFLGFIIIFYLVFPLLSWAIERFPKTTALIIAALYLGSIFGLGAATDVPMSVILTTRLPELAFGMYLVRFSASIRPHMAIPTALVLLAFEALDRFGASGAAALVNHAAFKDLSTTIVGLAAYVFLIAIADFVSIRPLRALVALIAKYSYPIFLVHHVIIYKLFTMSSIDWMSFNRVQVVTFFFAICALVFALAVALYAVTKRIIVFTSAAFEGEWWRPAIFSLPKVDSPSQAQDARPSADARSHANER